MNDVKRYKAESLYNEDLGEYEDSLYSCNDGDLVKLADYQALQAENKRLQKEVGKLGNQIGKERDQHNKWEIEFVGRMRDINKLKADVVREAVESAVSVWAGDIGDNVVLVDSLIEYANKLEAGYNT